MKIRIALIFVLITVCEVCTFGEGLESVFISVEVPQRNDFPTEACRQLELKLKRLLTTDNNIAENTPGSNFVLTAKVAVKSKDIIAGPPQMISENFDMIFMIGDVQENKVYETVTIPFVGVGLNENKAMIMAINKINPDDQKLKDFVKRAKVKILRYYEERCPQLIQQAKQQAASKNYDAAIYTLVQIPNISDCSNDAQNLALDYYEEYTNFEAVSLLNDAKAIWLAHPNEEGAAQVAVIIEKIPVLTNVQDNVDKFIKEVSSKLNADKNREWNFKMRKYNDEVSKAREQQRADNAARRQAISACRQIGLAYASNRPTVVYNQNLLLW